MEIAFIVLCIVGYFVIGFGWLMFDGLVIGTHYGAKRKSGLTFLLWPVVILIRLFAFVGKFFD